MFNISIVYILTFQVNKNVCIILVFEKTCISADVVLNNKHSTLVFLKFLKFVFNFKPTKFKYANFLDLRDSHSKHDFCK